MQASPKGAWAPSWKLSSSLEDFLEFDPDAQIGSPRSLAACDAQGILPRDLRYKPIELFQLPDVDPRIVQLRFDFMEARRQDLLSAARSTRQAIVELAGEAERAAQSGQSQKPKGEYGRNPDLHTVLQPSWQEGGPPDPSLAGAPTTPYPTALGFFAEVLDEYSFSKAAASPPTSPKAAESFDLGVTLPPVSQPLSPMKSPSRHVPIGELAPPLQRAASEPEIRGLLERVRTAPRATRADEDMSRKSEDLHITYPKLVGKWRNRAFAEENKLTKRRVEIATDCFDRLIVTDEENHQSLKLREAMHQQCQEDDPTRPTSPSASSLPASPFSTLRMNRTLRSSQSMRLGTASSARLGSAASSMRSSRGFGNTASSRVSTAEKLDHVREKNLGVKRDFEIHRAEEIQERINSSQQMKERLVSDAAAIKWKAAQELLEARLRWRGQYNKVATAAEEHERFKRDFFEKREEQQRQQRARTSDSSAMVREIRQLRDVARMLNQAQRDRKEAWRHSKKQREIMEKRLASQGLTVKLSQTFSSY